MVPWREEEKGEEEIEGGGARKIPFPPFQSHTLSYVYVCVCVCV